MRTLLRKLLEWLMGVGQTGGSGQVPTPPQGGGGPYLPPAPVPEPAPGPAPTPPSPPPATPTPPAIPTTPQDLSLSGQLLVAHNKQRVQAAIPSLKLDDRLQAAAQSYAELMARMQQLDHSLNGTTFISRIKANGYPVTGTSLGENIAMGYNSVASVMVGWMTSVGHRDNILDGGFRSVGFGMAIDKQGREYWCADFGSLIASPKSVKGCSGDDSGPKAVLVLRLPTPLIHPKYRDQ